MKKKFLYVILAILILFVGFYIGSLIKERDYQNKINFRKEFRSKKNVEISKSRNNAIINAVDNVSPAIVSIKTTFKDKNHSSNFYNEFFENFFGKNPYQKREKMSLGSGAIISKKGHILTAYHVVENADEIVVTLPNGRNFKAEILGSDQINDISLLKIDGNNLSFVEMGNSDSIMPGEWVIALGNPFGMMVSDPQPTVTVGVVSAIMRTINMEDDVSCDKIYGVIQTDAAINPGNSGGPLVNADGEIIGVNNSIFSTSGGSQGIGFAIPINNIRKSINDIIEYGEIKRGWLGIVIEDIPYSVKKKYQLDRSQGVIVKEVYNNSSAEKAGIEAGDIILSFNDSSVKNKKWWNGYKMRLSPHEKINLQIWNGEKDVGIEVKPDEFNYKTILKQFGIIEIENLKYKDLIDHNLRNQKGIIVKKVKRKSILYNKGMRENDVIRQIQGCSIYSRSQLKEILYQNMYNNKFVFIIERSGYLYKVEVEL